MNILTGLKGAGVFTGKLLTQLLKAGAFSTLSTWAQQESRESSRVVIGEIQRGVEHKVNQLKLIKDK